MNHDPDLPVADPELHMIHDPDHHDDLTFSGDSLSLSKSPSPQTSDSTLALVIHKEAQELLQGHPDVSARRSRGSDHESNHPDNESNTTGESLDADLLWLPANVHPEVNPQQFKSHVKNTIDELLERKLSRSKSANRSKRLSLSLSTTDQNYLSHALNETSVPKNDYNTPSNRYSNPSLRELTSELEMLSRMAGMDSNDAVTLARSLSSSSLGYTDVEKLAFDELGLPTHGSTNSNQAELLDFGVEETSPTARKSYVMSNQNLGLPPVFQGYPQNLRQRRGSPFYQQHPQSRRPSDHDQNNTSRIQQPQQTDEFALKRSRRLDYRKGPTTTPTQLGSQLQNHKAEKLAELRQNLSGVLTPLSGSSSDLLSVNRSSRSASRLSIQSINPRSSQILFSYKTPGSPSPSSRQQTPTARDGRGSPYASAANSSSASLGTPVQHPKYAQHKPYPNHSGPHPSSKHKNHQGAQGEHERTARKLSIGSAYPVESQRASGHPHHSSHGQHHRQRQVSPQTPSGQYPYQNHPHARQQHQGVIVAQNGPQIPAQTPVQHQYPGQHQPIVQQTGPNAFQQQQQQHVRGGHPLRSQRKPQGSPTTGASQPMSRQRQHTGEERRPHHVNSGVISKRDKSRELNQNLDLLRNEINEFKESLSKTEPKPNVTKDSSSAKYLVEPTQEAVPDISFDLTSHDVSYEDSLGMESDVLKQLDTEKSVTSPEPSPKTSPKKSPKRSPRKSPKKTTVHMDDLKSLTGNSSSTPEVVVAPPEDAPKMVPNNVFKTVSHDTQENVFDPDVRLVESKGQNENQPDSKDLSSRETRKEPENVRPALKAGAKIEDIGEIDPLKSAPVKVETQIKKNKSFGSLAPKAEPEKKKPGKKTWLWSKDRSVSATSTTTEQKGKFNVPTRSVSSPEIATNKREAPKRDEPTGKENVITKLFKKKRSNSVSTERPQGRVSPRQLLSETPELSDSVTNELKPRGSIKSTHNRESVKEAEPKAANEPKHSETTTRTKDKDSKGNDENTVTSRIKNKFKQIGKSHEEKVEPSVEDSVADADDEEAKDDDPKPQSTLEVQEKLKKSIKRTSRPNQPIEFTDSAFGFPLPPPSLSTLVMIDYRFPVHVERAIYRLSHLKLANPKRSLREQVLLSNFMYAYLNLVDHTLHLEHQMELEENLEQPEGDMDLFTADEADTEFETDDELGDNAFDSIKLDFDVQDSQQITA